MKKLLASLVGVTLTLGLFGAVATTGAGATPEPKVVVCKYVANENAPSGEVFGQVIEVSANALDGFDPNAGFPQTFTDNQGNSVAIGYTDTGLDATDCPGYVPPPTTTTVTIPPQCEDENGRPLEECEPTVTTTTPPPVTGGGPTPCPGSIKLSAWYGDPRINITLTGRGTFTVTGGVQRSTGTHKFDVALACQASQRIGRYKVEAGHHLRIYQDGILVVDQVPPVTHAPPPGK